MHTEPAGSYHSQRKQIYVRYSGIYPGEGRYENGERSQNDVRANSTTCVKMAIIAIKFHNFHFFD